MKYTVYVTRSEGCAVEVDAPDEYTARELAYAEAIDVYYDKQDWETLEIYVEAEQQS